jgi:hypothetical protein
MKVYVNISPLEVESQVLDLLAQAEPDVQWDVAPLSQAGFAVTVGPVDRPAISSVLVLDHICNPAEMKALLKQYIQKGDIALPTALGKEVVLAKFANAVDGLKKVRDNNPLIPKDILPAEFIDTTDELACHLVHGTAMKNYCPDLEKVLSGRAYRTLQRKVPNWKPIEPMFDVEHITDAYPKLPASGEELGDRIAKHGAELESLDITFDKSVLDYSQLNLGIPFPGGMHRKELNLQDPDDDLIFWMRASADFMVRGLSEIYNNDGPDAFHAFDTRVGVKVDNFQGPIMCTKSHMARQVLWSIMEENDDIFYFHSFLAVCCSGFRTQSNGWGKRRLSYIPVGHNVVASSRVIDGDDLEGLTIIEYSNLNAVAKDSIFFTDKGWIGGRKRYVANIESAQNDALLPVPAYLAHVKDKYYKIIFQQDLEILSRFVTGSREFDDFWESGFETCPLIAAKASEHFGITDSEDFLRYVNSVGERVLCGDVQNYDASATFSFVKPFFERLLSEKAMQALENLYNADKVGVYTDHLGQKQFYYITCNAEESAPAHIKDLISKTNEIMSSLPSGTAVTAQAGRGPMSAVLNHIFERALISFGWTKSDARNAILWMPEQAQDEPFTIEAAFKNDGGDDHNLGLLIVHILTGRPIGEITERMTEILEGYEFLSLLKEEPPMNCGFLFHEDEEGRCISISLSPARLFANTLYPEYSRSAIGLHASVSKYTESAIGTPIEEKMFAIAHIIITKIYGFESMEHLHQIAMLEEAYMSENPDMVPARQQIALELGIPENDLEWSYQYTDLVALGIDEDLLERFRKPLPSSLSRDPSKFFSMESVTNNLYLTEATNA